MDKTEQLLAAYLEQKQPSAQVQISVRQRIATATAMPSASQIQRQTADIFEKVFSSQKKVFNTLNRKLKWKAAYV